MPYSASWFSFNHRVARMKIVGSLHIHCTGMRYAKPRLVFPIGAERQIKFLLGVSFRDVFLGWIHAPKVRP